MVAAGCKVFAIPKAFAGVTACQGAAHLRQALIGNAGHEG
jgi:hypothetical protein